MHSEKFLRSVLGFAKFARGLVPAKLLQEKPELVKFLQSAVSQTFVSGDPDKNTLLDLCYRNGWLQAELSNDGTTVYVFASSLHRR